METKHAASPGSAPCSCARCRMLSLCFPPHTLECANVVFACPTNGTTAKRPAFVRRGAGGYVARLAAAPAAGMLSPCFLLLVANLHIPHVFSVSIANLQFFYDLPAQIADLHNYLSAFDLEPL